MQIDNFLFNYYKPAKFNMKKINEKKEEETKNRILDELLGPEREKETTLTPEELSPIKQLTDEEKIQQKVSKIVEKLKSGVELTPAEMEVLEEYAPAAHQTAVQANQEREDYRKELDRCRSKEEVNALRLKTGTKFLGKIRDAENAGNKQEADKQATFYKHTLNEHYIFTKTEDFLTLPQEVKEDDENKEKTP